uniref:Sulfatase-modifying factor enzyme-like domain-containing protein n=1 Tax=Zooxanthella nutricula TaxID=1333877 RepID=A0A7S2HUB9_9DINO
MKSTVQHIAARWGSAAAHRVAPGSTVLASAGGPGGARRHFKKAARVARVPHTAPLVTRTWAPETDPPASVPQVPAGGPKTLSTLQGRVALGGSDLGHLRHEAEADASLKGLPTPVLNDGDLTKSVQELETLRAEIILYFHKTFTLFEKLHEVFNNVPAIYEKHERLRHPPIFYLGHTASFYVNKLHLGKFIHHRLDPVLEMQMAVGVDEMSWDDWDSNSYVWPSGAEARADPAAAVEFLQKVLDLRRNVRVLVDDLMKQQPMEWPINKDSFWWIIVMGIEHERIHLETSSVIHRQAGLDEVQPIGVFPRCERGRFHKSPSASAARNMPANRLLPVPAGVTRLGRQWEGTATYGWDNEFGKEVHAEVPAFEASEFLVTNKEYLEFMEAGGYTTQRYWTEEGWSWVSDMKPTAPRFWRRSGDEHYLRTLCEEIPMPWDWPAEVCHNEAAAFCAYLSEKLGKTIRLPMEDEHMRMRDSVPTDLQDSAHGPAWGAWTPGNINLAFWASSCPVDTFKSPLGLYDVLGNVWQHCLTPIDVLEGFETHPLYDDFTTPTIGEAHSRIMGGAWM